MLCPAAAVLTERGHPYLYQPLFRAQLRWTHVDDLALDPQLVSRAHRVRPPEFVEAGTDNAASGLELALDQEPHGERRRVPAACRQAAEYAVGYFVDAGVQIGAAILGGSGATHKELAHGFRYFELARKAIECLHQRLVGRGTGFARRLGRPILLLVI